MFGEKSITVEGIVIEGNAWLGAGAIIADGVREGKGFVAAAGAVVMREVPLQVIGSVLVGRVVNHPIAVRIGIFFDRKRDL
jgi:acetyltransferase-like isoleucine patch superfamily enzyme